MATNPMMQQPPMADPEDQNEAPEPGAEQDDGSTELCIKIAQDGTISVYKESGEDETAEQSAQQVSDIGQALAWALKEYKSMDSRGATSQFDAGFGAKPPAQQRGMM